MYDAVYLHGTVRGITMEAKLATFYSGINATFIRTFVFARHDYEIRDTYIH